MSDGDLGGREFLRWFSCAPWALAGVGALYVRRRPRVRLEPIISGGGQERSVVVCAGASHVACRLTLPNFHHALRGLRSGTVPAPLAVGLGAACAIAKQDMAFDAEHVKRLSQRLKRGIMDKVGLGAQHVPTKLCTNGPHPITCHPSSFFLFSAGL